MGHPNQPPPGLMEILTNGCGYVDHEFDPNLISALDKLAEQFGPLGVAMAAASRTEPEALNKFLGEALNHQPELWQWLRCDRYWADAANNGQYWHVRDSASGEIVASVSHGPTDAEDAAHALAEHLNRKVTLAKVAQATVDTSAPGAAK